MSHIHLLKIFLCSYRIDFVFKYLNIHFVAFENGLCQEYDKEHKEGDQDTKDFNHQPSIVRDRLEIFEDLTMSRLHVKLSILNIGINPFDHLLLFFDHVRQLLKNAAQFNNRALDVLHSLGALLNVVI